MFRVNKKLEYGIIALFHLAHEPAVCSVKEMSKLYRIPEALLSKIMQKLKNAGLVSSVHGNQGGYRLSLDLSKISLLDLSQVLVGPIQVAECLRPGNDHCPVMPVCTILTPMNLLNAKLAQFFESTSLSTLDSQRGIG